MANINDVRDIIMRGFFFSFTKLTLLPTSVSLLSLNTGPLTSYYVYLEKRIGPVGSRDELTTTLGHQALYKRRNH